MQYTPFLLDYVMLLRFSHDRSNWSSLSFNGTKSNNLPDIYDLLFAPTSAVENKHIKSPTKVKKTRELRSSGLLRSG